MTKRHHELHPSQGSLLHMEGGYEQGRQVAVVAEHYPADPQEKLLGDQQVPVVYGPEGTYVNLSERADALTKSLGAFGLRNQRLGFDTASNVRPYNGPIWGRYRAGVPRVQEGAALNADKYMQEAKTNFWQATGFSGLRGKGLGSDDAIDALGRKMWRDYSVKYGDPNKKTARDDYKRVLKRTKKLSSKIIKDQAA